MLRELWGAMNNTLHFATGNDEMTTPQDFFDAASEAAGGFVADMAASLASTKVPENWWGPDHHDPTRQDSLVGLWPTDGPLWLNPPYSNPEEPCPKGTCKKKRCRERGYHCEVYLPGCVDFVRKAAIEMERGVETWTLLAARTSNEWFHDYIWDLDLNRPQPGRTVHFVRGRLRFGNTGNSAPFPSILVRFKLPRWPFGY
jgi:hypothetical protein